MNSSRVIRNYLNGLFMKRVMADKGWTKVGQRLDKGWTKEEAARHLENFVNCGKKISVSQYLKDL
jgi:hypothetical protein